jgi:hypothetical protein
MRYEQEGTDMPVASKFPIRIDPMLASKVGLLACHSRGVSVRLVTRTMLAVVSWWFETDGLSLLPGGVRLVAWNIPATYHQLNRISTPNNNVVKSAVSKECQPCSSTVVIAQIVMLGYSYGGAVHVDSP